MQQPPPGSGRPGAPGPQPRPAGPPAGSSGRPGPPPPPGARPGAAPRPAGPPAVPPVTQRPPQQGVPGPPPQPEWRPPQGAAPPSAPASAPAPVPAVPFMPPPRRKRSALRLTAGICVSSAWVTLILSVIGAFMLFMSGMAADRFAAQAPSSSTLRFPTPGGTPGGGLGGVLGSEGLEGEGGLSGGGLGDLGISRPDPSRAMSDLMFGGFRSAIPKLFYTSALFTLISGVVMWVLFLGLSQVCYVLLDLEEQSIQMQEALGIIVARLGSGR
ncbi:MAG: hypothetical protein ACK47B_09925 [Armatimonadota bacterium]